jgi:hypothetical protein
MSLDDRFFSRGGFLSSRFDDTEISKDVDVVNYMCQNYPIHNEVIISQTKSRRGNKKLKCGFST